MQLNNNLMARIKNAANVIKITNMTYQQQQIFLQNTRPDGVALEDWKITIALYLAYMEKEQMFEAVE